VSLVKHNNNSISAVTSMASLSTGSMVLISEQTASSSASISFTSGIDSTYPIYLFKFISCHPGTNGARLAFQVDTGTNTNYNTTATGTSFKSYHKEDGGSTYALGYDTYQDIAQGTGFVNLGTDVISNNDASVSGELYMFNPSSTTFVKHYLATAQGMTDGSPPYSEVRYKGGYFNTTTALTRIQFKMDSGNIDAGKIKLYGIKDS
jgi:hypothetical protein